VTEIIRVYDAASEHFPAGTQYAIPYIDGRYAATPEQVQAIPHVRWNTVLAGQASAAKAGVCDFEPGNESFENPAALRAWAEARLAAGNLARCYTNFDNLALAAERLQGLGNVRWWLATLDGVGCTAAELAAMAARYHVTLDPARVWAQQVSGGLTAAYDTSFLLSAW
jgi:hypothetical protein